MEEVPKLYPELQKALAKYISKSPPVFKFESTRVYDNDPPELTGATGILQDRYIIERNGRIRLNYECNFTDSQIKMTVKEQIKKFKDPHCKDCHVLFCTPYRPGYVTVNTHWKPLLLIEKNEKYIIWQETHYFNVETYHRVFCMLLDKLVSQLQHLV